MNVIAILATLSPSSIKLFEVMVRVRNRVTNEVVREDLMEHEPVNARFIQNHMPLLINRCLVLRVRRGVYMLNPDAVMPQNINAAREVWLSLAAEKTEAPPL